MKNITIKSYLSCNCCGHLSDFDETKPLDEQFVCTECGSWDTDKLNEDELKW